MVASRAIAVARPSPIIFTSGSAPRTKPPKTATMISAAEVIVRAVPARPRTTASSLSPVRTYSSRIRDRRKTS